MTSEDSFEQVVNQLVDAYVHTRERIYSKSNQAAPPLTPEEVDSITREILSTALAITRSRTYATQPDTGEVSH